MKHVMFDIPGPPKAGDPESEVERQINLIVNGGHYRVSAVLDPLFVASARMSLDGGRTWVSTAYDHHVVCAGHYRVVAGR